MFTTSTTTSDYRPAATERWRVAVADTVAAFSVRELGVWRVRGTIPVVDGVVEVDSAGVVTSLTATLDPAGIATGNARRDADLRGRKLLDVASHPRWTFRADQAERTATGWTVHGSFEATAPVELTLHVTETASGRFTATATLDRRAAGVRAPRFLIGRRVDVELDVRLVRDSQPRGTS
ncbi:MAG TPA: YceI family protein [Jatrophihabitantaceae bacterium]|jgi:polyisoprenoid-binding protein YceI